MSLVFYTLILIIILPLILLLAQTGKITETSYHFHFGFCCLRQAVQLRVNKHRKPGDGPNTVMALKTELNTAGLSARANVLNTLQAGMSSPKN